MVRLSSLLGGILTLGAISGASAADMAVKARPAVAPVPSYSWTGCYVGVNAGYGWSDQTDVIRPSPDAASQAFWNAAFAAAAIPTNYGYRTDGAAAGGQVGCNWQSGRFVLGIEGDIDWTDIGGSRSFTTNVPGFVTGISNSSRDLHWLGTVRGRAGFTATDTLLLYVTGGVAFGEVRYGGLASFPASNDIQTFASTNTETGWTAGVGAEWAFNANWTVKAEYLYVDLGSRTLTSVATGRAANLATNLRDTYDNTYNIVRVGLNYKFGAPASVVAKY